MNLNRPSASRATSSGNHSRDRVPVDSGPLGEITAGGDKEYPIGYSHLRILGGAPELEAFDEANPDQAVFPEVDTSTVYGHTHPVRVRMPIFTGVPGSTHNGRKHWDGLAAGAAVSGIPLVVGEDVCASDPGLELDKNGRVTRSPEMERRVKVYRDWQDEDGDVIVQMNVEDARLEVAQYVVNELGVETIELKLGHGCHSGASAVRDLEQALDLRRRGYIVTPNPADSTVQAAFEAGEIRQFERHARQGFVDEEGLLRSVEHLRREVGAKRVTLKIGVCAARDLAMALKWSSQARVDLLTIEGSPTFYLQCTAYRLAEELAGRGQWVPDLAMAGGFSTAEHIFKVLALGAPYFRAVCTGQALAQAVLGPANGHKATADQTLAQRLGRSAIERLPPGAIAMCVYLDKLRSRLAQLMAAVRSFRPDTLKRSDVDALTEDAAKVSGIPYIMDAVMVALGGSGRHREL